MITTRALVISLLAAAGACAQQADEQIQGHIFRTERVEATDERINSLKLPPGFKVTKFAENLGKPRMLAIDSDGSVYVTRRDDNDCLLLRDIDRDGKADDQRPVAQGLKGVHGLAIHDGHLFLCAPTTLYAARMDEDGSIETPRPIFTDLPDGGQHPNRTLAFDREGNLFITVGSTCNACVETNPEHASILIVDKTGSRRVFASGLRNTIGFGWHPETGEMYGFDHGSDWLGDNTNKEEFNRIEDGKWYGWPHVYEASGIDPAVQIPEGTSKDELIQRNTAPLLTHTAHAAPIGMVFYTGGQFPGEYKGDAIACMHGSWNRKPASGYEIVRVRFENNQPAAIEPFISGFLVENGTRHFARPCGLAQHPDGSLLFTDDAGGVIYRITYEPALLATPEAAPFEPPPVEPLTTPSTDPNHKPEKPPKDELVSPDPL